MSAPITRGISLSNGILRRRETIGSALLSIKRQLPNLTRLIIPDMQVIPIAEHRIERIFRIGTGIGRKTFVCFFGFHLLAIV